MPWDSRVDKNVDKKGDLEVTFVKLPGVFYSIHWNYYVYLLFQVVPTNSFEPILSHWKKNHTHLVWQVINCD